MMMKTSMTRPMSTLTVLIRGEFGRAEIHAASPPSGASFGVLEILKRGNRAYVAGGDLHVFWAWPRLAFSLEKSCGPSEARSICILSAVVRAAGVSQHLYFGRCREGCRSFVLQLLKVNGVLDVWS